MKLPKNVIESIKQNKFRLTAIRRDNKLYGWRAFRDNEFLGFYWL